MRRVAAAFVLLAALAGSANAQKEPAPGGRQGFWIGFGVGIGSAGLDCATCGEDRFSGGSGYLRMGGTLSQAWLLGGEVNVWSHSESGTDEALVFASIVAYWYPSRTGGLHLKFGLGGMGYAATDGTDELTASGAGYILGVGYEVRVRPNLSITPFLNGMASGNTELRINNQVVATNADLRLNLVQIGIGLTWH